LKKKKEFSLPLSKEICTELNHALDQLPPEIQMEHLYLEVRWKKSDHESIGLLQCLQDYGMHRHNNATVAAKSLRPDPTSNTMSVSLQWSNGSNMSTTANTSSLPSSSSSVHGTHNNIHHPLLSTSARSIANPVLAHHTDDNAQHLKLTSWLSCNTRGTANGNPTNDGAIATTKSGTYPLFPHNSHDRDCGFVFDGSQKMELE
ncbi:hypothetical protein RFI_36910, partial [Reticulomyxa filosa]